MINVLTVHYDTQQFIENIANLLGREADLRFRFIVVDNSNNLDRNRLNCRENLDIVIVKNRTKSSNVVDSHRTALNAGLAAIDFEQPYTLFLDPDVGFTKNAIQKCKKYIDDKDCDVIGVHKFYQYKTGNEKCYPYVWFTMIKTGALRGFSFRPVNHRLFQIVFDHARRDTGDSLYDLIRTRHLTYHAILKYPKDLQPTSYLFHDIETDDWEDSQLGIAVTHYRGGSDDRNEVIHQSHAVSHMELFINKTRYFKF
jgi:hypothetical protein